MKRFWIKFALTINDPHPVGVLPGCGVTATSTETALDLVRRRVFDGGDLPAIEEIREDVQLECLDKNHVIPNMGDPGKEGIWFPLGY